MRWNRGNAALAVIQAPGRERIARLCQQCPDSRTGTASRLQLTGNRFGFSLRHLQFAGQCQCPCTALQVIGLQAVAGLLQRCRAGIGQAWRACGRSPSSASTAW